MLAAALLRPQHTPNTKHHWALPGTPKIKTWMWMQTQRTQSNAHVCFFPPWLKLRRVCISPFLFFWPERKERERKVGWGVGSGTQCTLYVLAPGIYIPNRYSPFITLMPPFSCCFNLSQWSSSKVICFSWISQDQWTKLLNDIWSFCGQRIRKSLSPYPIACQSFLMASPCMVSPTLIKHLMVKVLTGRNCKNPRRKRPLVSPRNSVDCFYRHVISAIRP
jgi:hypothetical protein